MPTHPYRRLGPIDRFEAGQVLVGRSWREEAHMFYKILEVLPDGKVKTVNQEGNIRTYGPYAFGPASAWILIEDDVPYKKARRPKSGFGLFVKKLDDHDKTLDIHAA